MWTASNKRSLHNPITVSVQGAYAYVVNQNSDTLQVFNVSNPAAPSLTGSAGTGSEPWSVSVQGNYAYVVDVSGDALQVFNVSNPASPKLAGSVGTASGPWSVVVQGSYAYVVTGGSDALQVFDVSNPASPKLAGSVGTGSIPQNVSVQGNFAYLVNFNSHTLEVFDVSNPASPKLAGSAHTAPAPDWVSVQGGYAYVTHEFVNTMEVFNVSNPASPRLAGSTATGADPVSVSVQGNFAYLVDASGNTLEVFNVSNPAVPTVAGSAATGSAPESVCVQDGFAYVTNYGSDTLQVFDVTNPTVWYLAEGTNAWGFNTYITLENPNQAAVHAKLTFMNTSPGSAGNGAITSRTYALPPLSQTTISSADVIGPVDFSTKVESLEGKAIAVDRTMFWNGVGSTVGYHSTIGTSTLCKLWYLPEGSSNWGFETWTEVLNPNDSNAILTLTYMTENGPLVRTKSLPANTRATYSMSSDIGGADASIQVTSDLPVVAERSMYNQGRREGSCSIGATIPAEDYYLAEGAVGYDVGFTTYVLVQNPNNTTNDVKLTYQTAKGPALGPHFTMAPNSRKTINIGEGMPPDEDVSTVVTGTKPLVAERAMYFKGRISGTDTIGAFSE